VFVVHTTVELCVLLYLVHSCILFFASCYIDFDADDVTGL